MYIGLSVPVIGAGVAVDGIGLQSGGELFSGAVGLVVAAVGLSLLVETARHPEVAEPAVLPRRPAIGGGAAAPAFAAPDAEAPGQLHQPVRAVLYL
jgi:hypothetical protein